jgi:hypothetical protein
MLNLTPLPILNGGSSVLYVDHFQAGLHSDFAHPPIEGEDMSS